MYIPQIGDIGVSSSHSVVGKIIRVAQAVVGDWSIYSHAFVYVGDGKVVEAMPSGARLAKLDQYDDSYVTAFSKFNLNEEQRSQIVMHALEFVGKPYGWMNYLALGAMRFNISPNYFIEKVKRSDSYICSHLCAEVYSRAGVQLFEDNRHPMEVTPGDLANLFIRL